MARPRIKKENHRKNIALTLPPDLINRAKSTCSVYGWSVSSTVEIALRNYLDGVDRKIKKS